MTLTTIERQDQQTVSNSPVELFNHQTTLATFLGEYRMDKIRDQASFLQAPAVIKAYDLPNSYVVSVLFPHQYLFGQGLIDVLTQSRPPRKRKYDSGPFSKEAILADWSIPDHPDERENARLLEIHERLGPKWHDFNIKDRRRFMAAIAPIPTEEMEKRVFAVLERAVGPHDVTRLKREARYSLRHWKRIEFGGGLGFMKFAEVPEELQAELIHRAEIAAVEDRFVIDPLAPPQQLFYELEDENTFYQTTLVHKGDGVVRAECNTTWAEINVTRKTKQSIASHKGTPEESALIPWMVWQVHKGNRNRTYLESDIPEFLTAQVDPRANSRLGLILATALSPKQRGQLPLEFGRRLPGAEYDQTMNEPQTPLLVSLFQKTIMESDLFTRIEEEIGITRTPFTEKLKRNFRDFIPYAVRETFIAGIDLLSHKKLSFLLAAALSIASISDLWFFIPQEVNTQVAKEYPQVLAGEKLSELPNLREIDPGIIIQTQDSLKRKKELQDEMNPRKNRDAALSLLSVILTIASQIAPSKKNRR